MRLFRDLIINTLLIFVIFRRITSAFWPSALLAAAFGLHPMHVESVAWISERKDVLSTLFWLLTTAAYCHYVRRPNVSRYILTIVLFALGLMVKPMLVTLPFVLLLLDYWPLDRFKKRNLFYLVLEKLPLFILTTVSCVIAVIVQSKTGALAGIKQFPLSVRIFNGLLSYVRYIVKMVWPVDLAVFYPLAGDTQLWWQVLGAAVFLAGITIVVLRVSRKYKYLLTGWFWYLGTLVSVIGLVQVGEQSMADRYTYIPFIGLFIAVIWTVTDLSAKWRYRKTVLGVLSSAIILILAIFAWIQVGFWRDSMSLFEHALKVTSENYVACNNLGNAYYDKGAYDLAITNFNRAVEINPRFADAYYNRANTYKSKDEFDRAISDYSSAIKINPKYAEAYYNRGFVYKSRGLYDLAVADYNKTIELNPADADAYNNRGNAYKSEGKYELAVRDYNKAIEINPRYFLAWLNKASVYTNHSFNFPNMPMTYCKGRQSIPGWP